MTRILFTGGGGAAAEAIFRLLGARYDLHFADGDRDAIAPTIPPERRHSVAMARDDHFVENVAALVTQLRIDVVVPGVDEELVKLAEAAARLAPARLLLPSADFVALHLDKLASMRALAAHGLSHPRTVPIRDAASLPAPFIAKPASGRGSRGVEKLRAHDDVPAYLTLYRSAPDKVIAQELIEGQEYTVFVAADDAGRLRAVVPVKVGSKKGVTIAAETEAHPDVIAYARDFQTAFGARGVYNIQLMLKDGVCYPFEINPRVSTTFCLVLAEGYDPFADLAAPHAGEVYTPRRRVTLRRNWFNHFGGDFSPA
ncbi:MAG: ATP-grasp domain-containing protein [Rhizobiales bacterium]|nr:ATP-grasp domain-containing protein [Hyphomicrobiales bacterium]